MKLITIDMDALARAIDSNTDASEQEARAIINTVLAASAPAHPVAAEGVEKMSDETVRAAFRVYDEVPGKVRNQTPWQIWRDAVVWAEAALSGSDESKGGASWVNKNSQPPSLPRREASTMTDPIREALYKVEEALSRCYEVLDTQAQEPAQAQGASPAEALLTECSDCKRREAYGSWPHRRPGCPKCADS